jgi:hypothetical protein
VPPDINVNPGNSPYNVPSPQANYGTVTIVLGGFLNFTQPTTMTCTALVKSTSLSEAEQPKK